MWDGSQTTQAKVTNFNFAVFVDQDVITLEVPVNDTLMVEVGNTLQNLVSDQLYGFGRQFIFDQGLHVTQRPKLQILLDIYALSVQLEVFLQIIIAILGTDLHKISFDFYLNNFIHIHMIKITQKADFSQD